VISLGEQSLTDANAPQAAQPQDPEPAAGEEGSAKDSSPAVPSEAHSKAQDAAAADEGYPNKPADTMSGEQPAVMWHLLRLGSSTTLLHVMRQHNTRQLHICNSR
jgi:hypothetical protein